MKEVQNDKFKYKKINEIGPLSVIQHEHLNMLPPKAQNILPPSEAIEFEFIQLNSKDTEILLSH